MTESEENEHDRTARHRLADERAKAGDDRHQLLDYELDPNVIELMKGGEAASEILLIDCPYCGHTSYYSGGFTSSCTWCGEEIADYSDEARSVEDEIVGACFDEYRAPGWNADPEALPVPKD